MSARLFGDLTFGDGAFGGESITGSIDDVAVTSEANWNGAQPGILHRSPNRGRDRRRDVFLGRVDRFPRGTQR